MDEVRSGGIGGPTCPAKVKAIDILTLKSLMSLYPIRRMFNRRPGVTAGFGYKPKGLDAYRQGSKQMAKFSGR